MNPPLARLKMMLPSRGRFEPQNNVYGKRRLSFTVGQRCASPFRHRLPTTCSDVTIYSDCAERRANVFCAVWMRGRLQVGSFSFFCLPFNLPYQNCVPGTRDNKTLPQPDPRARSLEVLGAHPKGNE